MASFYFLYSADRGTRPGSGRQRRALPEGVREPSGQLHDAPETGPLRGR
ncbi:hypothetical protein ACFPM0_11080 [Pseudonocardia sulfidoxydans]